MNNERNLILKLNNYGYSPEVLEEVREFKTTGKIPDYIKGKVRYSKKWQPFYIANNHLIYRPKELKVILDPDEKQQIMKEVFDNDRTGVGTGVTQFYHNICLKYLNIQRKEVGDFLMKQKTYQISRNTRHRINKPILAFAPNERWAIDLVSMERYSKQNKGYIQILTCVDFYSRYVWARPLKNKKSADVVVALRDICNKAGVYPEILQKDGGGEFQGATNTFMEGHNIKWINTLSYSPQSNGLIENFNNQLRKMLRELMIRHGNLVWYNQLDLCCSIKNRQRNSTTKKRPIDIWQNTPYTRAERFNNHEVAMNTSEKARKDVLKNTTQEFELGDYVRVKLLQLYSQIRKMVKDGEKKYIVVKYSPEIYVIDKILRPDRAGYEKLRYTLKTLGGEPLLTQKKWNKPNKIRRQKRFFASDFIKIEKEDMPDNITYEPSDGADEDAKYKQNDGLDIYKALKLNVIEDKETEAKKPKAPKKVRIKKEPVPVVPSVKPTRVKKPNQFLKDFVEINDDGEVTKVLGTGFVLIGGIKHFFK